MGMPFEQYIFWHLWSQYPQFCKQESTNNTRSHRHKNGQTNRLGRIDSAFDAYQEYIHFTTPIKLLFGCCKRYDPMIIPSPPSPSPRPHSSPLSTVVDIKTTFEEAADGMNSKFDVLTDIKKIFSNNSICATTPTWHTLCVVLTGLHSHKYLQRNLYKNMSLTMFLYVKRR